jgi:hypothetical protein
MKPLQRIKIYDKHVSNRHRYGIESSPFFSHLTVYIHHMLNILSHHLMFLTNLTLQVKFEQ